MAMYVRFVGEEVNSLFEGPRDTKVSIDNNRVATGSQKQTPVVTSFYQTLIVYDDRRF
jgi:hypothetical protein